MNVCWEMKMNFEGNDEGKVRYKRILRAFP